MIESLIAAAQSGDTSAMGYLLEQFRPFLLQIANEEIDPKLQSKVGGSDLVQQSLMEAGQSFGEFQGQTATAVSAWLRRILINNIANIRRHYHSDKRNIQLELRMAGTDSKSHDMRTLPADRSSPSGALRKQEELKQMELALSMLSEDHRRVIQLRNYHKKSFLQIGEEIGKSADAARKLWGRGIEALQQIYQSLDEKSV